MMTTFGPGWASLGTVNDPMAGLVSVGACKVARTGPVREFQRRLTGPVTVKLLPVTAIWSPGLALTVDRCTAGPDTQAHAVAEAMSMTATIAIPPNITRRDFIATLLREGRISP
jgi:hypothetical protein